MLLILAGVALATLTGQGNIIGNAENAVGKYNNSEASEQQLLNEIEKYFQNYLEGENVEEDKGVPVDKTEIANNPEEHFGGYVDYTAPNGDPEVKWRIFYADEENVYLIADDYINPEYSPANGNGGVISKYDIPLSNIYDYAEDAKEITDPRIIKIASFLNYEIDYSSTNVKGSIAMLDTTIWEMYINSTYAEYAIGGPTIDLFSASYNKLYTPKIDYRVSAGKSQVYYELKWSEDENYNYELYGLDTSNSIYTKSNEKASSVWLASPYDTAVGEAFSVSGNYIRPAVDSGANKGFRPIVCLKSEVQLNKKSDGTYTLSLPE